MIETDAILDALVSHVMTTGHFRSVNTHEPKSAPPKGLHCAIWVEDISCAALDGLAASSALLVFNMRIYGPMLSKPEDEIDPAMIRATDAIFALLHGDFTLDGLVRCVDLKGMSGVPLRGQAGYLQIDNTHMRIMTITVPLIVNDTWEQSP